MLSSVRFVNAQSWENVYFHFSSVSVLTNFHSRCLAVVGPEQEGSVLRLGSGWRTSAVHGHAAAGGHSPFPDFFFFFFFTSAFGVLTRRCPRQVELTQLSACRDALWGLDTHGRVFIRTLSSPCPAGLHWTSLDLSQLGTRRRSPIRSRRPSLRQQMTVVIIAHVLCGP